MSLNKVIIMGRITQPLEVKQSKRGLSVLRFTVAVDRYSKTEEKQADFISCVAFGKNAEFIESYFGKGRMIALEGSLKTGSYEKDGVKHYTTDVVVDSVSFTGEPKEERSQDSWYCEHDAQVYQQSRTATAQSQGGRYPGTDKQEPVSLEGFEDVLDVLDDNGVPF